MYLEQCFVDDTTVVECTDQQCMAAVQQIEGEKDQVELSCNPASSVSLQILNIFDLTIKSVDFKLYMHCEYDKCNDKSSLDKVKSVVAEHYNVSSLHQILGYATKSTVEAEINSSTKSSTSSSTQMKINEQPSSTSVTNPYGNSTITTNSVKTTTKNNGQHIQSANAMIYVALIALMSLLKYSRLC